jgi:hypothetical protein
MARNTNHIPGKEGPWLDNGACKLVVVGFIDNFIEKRRKEHPKSSVEDTRASTQRSVIQNPCQTVTDGKSDRDYQSNARRGQCELQPQDGTVIHSELHRAAGQNRTASHSPERIADAAG